MRCPNNAAGRALTRVGGAVLALMVCCGWSPLVAAADWVVAFGNDNPQLALYDVFFFDRTNGWVCGYDAAAGNGAIFHNDDGMTGNWVPQTVPTGCGAIRKIQFVSQEEGWAVGDAGTLLHYTSAGGWVREGSESIDLTCLFFLDGGQRGWYGSSQPWLKRTVDGGGSWSNHLGLVARSVDLVFYADGVGWVAQGNFPYLQYTTNDGDTFEDTIFPFSSMVTGLTIAPNTEVFAVDLQGKVWRGHTTYPDREWTAVDGAQFAGVYWNAIDFADEEPAFGWVVGVYDSIAITSDAGLNWTAEPGGLSGLNLSGVSALAPDFAWAAGQGPGGGVLLRRGCSLDADCDDGDFCNGTETCPVDACVAGAPPICDDGEVCTDDSCDPASGCVFVPNTSACDDGDACTAVDTCSGGTCSGVPVSCDDGDVCTDDSCNSAIGCEHTFNSAPCDDGEPCTTGDHCLGGACQGTADPCDDGVDCTVDSCQTGVGCQHVPSDPACDDGIACTTEHCDPLSGCLVTPDDVACADSDPCTTDSCQLGVGCIHSAAPDDIVCGPRVCDGLRWGEPVCLSGTCSGMRLLEDCDDGNGCTDDDCLPSAGCDHRDNSNPCEDGDFCTLGDFCQAGLCVAGMTRDCDDGNRCTQDSCRPATGQCDHVPIDCDDGNPCTDDECDAFLGCQNYPNTAACDDGLDCTREDQCQDGACVGVPYSCDDGDPCTADRCDGQGGCEYDSVVVGTACGLCGACDAAGGCSPVAEGTPCDDDDPCSPQGHCDGSRRCQIEAWCDRTLTGCPLEEGFRYGIEEGETIACRLSDDRVELEVDVQPLRSEPGGYLPIRLRLATGGKRLIRPVVRLEFAVSDESLAYVLGETRVLESGVTLRERGVDDGQVVWLEFEADEEATERLGDSGWWLSLLLLQRAEGSFSIDVWTDCPSVESNGYDIGCHFGGAEELNRFDMALVESDGERLLQRVSSSLNVRSSGGLFRSNSMNDGLVGSGCECSHSGSWPYGAVWLGVLLGLGWFWRRRG